MSYIEGTVADIIYRNEQNSYTVLELEAEGNLIVCVGSIPLVQPGEYVRFYGGYTTHKTYGRQFKVTGMESRMPESDESIRLFLAGGLIKGVGEVTAGRIVDRFHAETFAVIENDPDRLAEVHGISLKQARRIHEQFMDMQTVRGIVMQLQSMGLSIKEAMAAYEAYGSSAPFLIEKNPYRLMDDVRGIGFAKADRIAETLGAEKYSDLRTQSAIRHVLKQSMLSGHTCLPEGLLLRRAEEFLQVEPAEAEEALKALIASGYVAENSYNSVRAVADSQAYLAEGYIAYKLVALSRAVPRREVPAEVVDRVLAAEEMLSEKQREAVRMAVESPVSVITGGPGTGKTTILNQVLKIFEQSGVVALLAAPTGRAAKRMEGATGRQAKTIHRLLEYGANPDDEDAADFSRFGRDEDHPLEADAVLVDESSMIDIFLMRSLLAAVEEGTRVLFLGDADQLPSVGPGNVLKDILTSKAVPSTVLEEVFRAGGNLVLNAHKVNLGEQIDLFSAGDFVFLPAASADDTLLQTLSQYMRRIEAGDSIEEVQVICPVKKGTIGVYRINAEIRERVNPRRVDKREATFGETLFREGDKVMQIVNNYTKTWHIDGASPVLTRGEGVYNGDMGRIVRISPEERTLHILFDGERIAEYDFEELSQLEHAYAVTVHKSQGSEFETVLLPLYYGRSDFLTRNLFYTAMTRARKKLLLLGREATVRHMIRNAKISQRYTALDHEIKKELEFAENAGVRPLFSREPADRDDLLDLFPEEEP